MLSTIRSSRFSLVLSVVALSLLLFCCKVVCVMGGIQNGIDIHWDTLKIVLGSY